MLRAALLVGLAVAGSGQASAESCRQTGAERTSREARQACRPEERLEPYDPDRVRAGKRPGFIDLGNGTEVRVGGRVRLDYDMRR